MERAVAERANPYSPPDHGVRPLPRQSSGAATVLLGVLLVELALRAFRATLYLAVFFRWEGYQNAILTLTPGPLELSWALTWPLLALVVVSFSVWVFRANRDARSLGAKGMFFSAGRNVFLGRMERWDRFCSRREPDRSVPLREGNLSG